MSDKNLASLVDINLDSVVLPPPPELTEEERIAEERKEECDRTSNYGRDSRHVLILEAPVDVSRESFLRDLFGDKPNIPGEAEALPGAPGMATRDLLQPRFPPDALMKFICIIYLFSLLVPLSDQSCFFFFQSCFFRHRHRQSYCAIGALFLQSPIFRGHWGR